MSYSNRPTTIRTTALINGEEVEYDGMSDFYTQSEIDFYSEENGWEIPDGDNIVYNWKKPKKKPSTLKPTIKRKKK